ncbi:legume-like lectin [Abortiporus biennis]|nr:legume-like lectin [Abortiporus biennis]
MMKLSAALFFLTLGLLPWGVVGAQNDVKIANRTIERTVSLRTHSLYAPYIDQDLQNRWWDFGADAYVNTNKHIRLTRDRSSQMGWLWSRLPLTSTNFILEVEFKIGGGDSNHLFGDGMGIWLTTGRAQPGPVFGNADQWEGLGIVLDTYANSRHSYAFPRIYAFNGDGKTKYDKDNDGDSQALAACSANFRRTNVATKMKITYIKGAYLNLKVQYKAWDEWTECLTLPNFELPNAPFLGFTAETGDVSDSHDIISVTAYSAILSDPNAPKDKLVGAQPLKTPSTWLSSLFKFILFIGVIAGAMFGYNKYQLSKLSARSPLAYGGRSPSGFGGGLYADAKRF